MNKFQVVRIVALLVVIFAAGFGTGRLTAPRVPTLVPDATGGVATAESRLAMLTTELGLDAGQQKEFRRLLEDIAKQLVHHPPASEERRAIFHNYAPRMRALLKPEQQGDFDRYVQRIDRQFEQFKRKQRPP